MNTNTILLFITITLCSYQSHATTCKPLTDRIIAHCVNGNCNQLLYIQEIKYGQECGRRPVIVDTPVWAKPIIEFEVAQYKSEINDAVYEVSVLGLKRGFFDRRITVDTYKQNRLLEDNKFRYYVRVNEYRLKDIEKLNQFWVEKESNGLTHMIVEILLLVVSVVVLFLTLALQLSGVRELLIIPVLISLVIQCVLFSLMLIQVFYLHPKAIYLIYMLPAIMICNGFAVMFVLFSKMKIKFNRV